MNRYKLFKLFAKADLCDLPAVEIPLNEQSDITYYELRRLVTMLFRTVKDKMSKTVLADILKALTVMELRKQPVPTIQKLKSNSPKIFGD